MIENVPLLGKAIAFSRNLRERLMKTVAVVDAHLVPRSRTTLSDENLFLVWVDVYPSSRQTRYDAVSVEGCMLLYFTYATDERGQRLYAPDWTRGALPSMPVNLLVSPDQAQCQPSSLLFFVQPRDGIERTTIKLHSPYFLMSVSCDIILNHTVGSPVVRRL